MQKKKAYIIMAAISLLLAFIIFLQLRWIGEVENAAQREINLKAQNALQTIERDIIKSISCVELFTKHPIKPGEGFYFLKQKWGPGGFNGEVDTIDLFYDRNDYMDKNYKGNVPYRYGSIKASIPISIDVMTRLNFEIADTHTFYRFAEEYKKIDEGNFKNIILNNGRSFADIDTNLVDSLIRAALLREQITTRYGFGFTKDDKVIYAARVSDSGKLLQSPYHTQLFLRDKFIENYKLSLVFIEDGDYVVNGWLLLGCLALALLTYAFYVLIKIYYSQSRLSEMKSDFINNLTHEFNTPMANISLAIQTMQAEGYQKNTHLHKILHIISAESQRLRENIDRILQVATIDKGKIHLKKEEVDLVAMIETIEPTYQLQCNQLNGSISFKSAADTATICGDEMHLLNTVCNLLDNAIKYRSGMPEISIRLYEKGKNYLIEVGDNGKGMSPRTQKHIFDKFYRAHEGLVHTTKGFGLGLNYVKGIAEAHNGGVYVQSKLGKGSTFYVYLPKKLNSVC